MTIREIATQLFQASGGHISGGHMNREQISRFIAARMQNPANLKAGNRLVLSILLPDGEWLFTVEKWGDGPDGYSYTIPETREQETRIKELLFAGNGGRT